jgi:DNA segregation ATPase FtsK/SpoIIIE, S-DNA-T family
MVRAESVVDAPPAGPHDAAMARVVVTNAKPTGVVPLAAGVVVALATAGAVMLVALVALAVWLAARHPFVAAFLGGSALAVAGAGLPGAVVLWGVLIAGALAWRGRDRDGFDRAVRRRWRRGTVYGRRWRRTMVAVGLDGPGEWRRPVPRLGEIRSTRWTDTVRMHLLADQTAEMVAARAPWIAQGLGARTCKVRDDGAGSVTLELRRGDPLSRPLPPLAVPARPDLDSLVVGVHEDGRPWSLRLTRGHLLVTGAPGTGDGVGRESVVWSVVRALAARVGDGSVELWGVDGSPAGDLAVGRPLFTRFAVGTPGPGLPLIEDAAALVIDRRPGPGRDDRAVVLVLDEITGWGDALDVGARRRLDRSMELILTRGAAAKVVVVATMRTPPTAAGSWFRHVVRVGPDGVAWAAEGRGTPHRVRAAGLADDDVAALAARYRPLDRAPRPPEPAVPPATPIRDAFVDDSGPAEVRRTA